MRCHLACFPKKRKPPHRAPTRPASVTGGTRPRLLKALALCSPCPRRSISGLSAPCPALCPVPSNPDSLEVRCAVLSPPHRFRLIKPQARRFVKHILTIYHKKAFFVFSLADITNGIIIQMCKFCFNHWSFALGWCIIELFCGKKTISRGRSFLPPGIRRKSL